MLMKNLRNILLFSLSILSLPSFADYMSCDAAGNCTLVSTGSSSPSYPSGSSNPPPIPSGMNYGPGYAQAMAAKAAAEKQGCLTGVAQTFGDKCKNQSSDIKQSNLQQCNNQAKYGGVVGFVGAAGIGLGIALSGPVGWIIGAVSLVGGAGGTWYGLDGATSCRDAADAAYNYNITTACPNYVKNAQAAYCPK